MHKVVSKSTKMLTNWKNEVGKLIRNGKKTHTCFYRRKGWRMMWEKNKSTTPSIAFPFSLILNKTGSFTEKADMHFGGFGINNTC